MKRKMSYKKLWKLLIDRDMKRTDLRKNAGISSSSLAKLGKDENVTTDVLLRICDSLDAELNEIAETVPCEEVSAEVRSDAGRSRTRLHQGSQTVGPVRTAVLSMPYGMGNEDCEEEAWQRRISRAATIS